VERGAIARLWGDRGAGRLPTGRQPPSLSPCNRVACRPLVSFHYANPVGQLHARSTCMQDCTLSTLLFIIYSFPRICMGIAGHMRHAQACNLYIIFSLFHYLFTFFLLFLFYFFHYLFTTTGLPRVPLQRAWARVFRWPPHPPH